MDDMPDMEMLVCRDCGRPTCEPPDELIEFKGMCPGCVIKQEVYPILPARFRDLVESIIESRDDMLADHIISKMTGGMKHGVAIVVDLKQMGDDSSDFDSDAMSTKVMEVFKHIILHDEEARAKLKEVIEVIDQKHGEGGACSCGDPEHKPIAGKVKKPVVRNDPRTG
jgi:hypothetical protein